MSRNKYGSPRRAPVVVDFIGKYHPECQPHVSGILSPLLAHCKMLRARYGGDIAIVFIGPCIAKKKEAGQHPELLDVVLTFEDLDGWLAEENIRLAEIVETAADRFEPESAQEGALYPIEGGMAPGVTRRARGGQSEFHVVFGHPQRGAGAEGNYGLEAGA